MPARTARSAWLVEKGEDLVDDVAFVDRYALVVHDDDRHVGSDGFGQQRVVKAPDGVKDVATGGAGGRKDVRLERVDGDHGVGSAFAHAANDGNQAPQFLAGVDRRRAGTGRFGADVDKIRAACQLREGVRNRVGGFGARVAGE